MLMVMKYLNLAPHSRLVYPTVYLQCMLGCLTINSNFALCCIRPSPLFHLPGFAPVPGGRGELCADYRPPAAGSFWLRVVLGLCA